MASGPAQRSRSNLRNTRDLREREREREVNQLFKVVTKALNRNVVFLMVNVASYKGECGLINRVEQLFFVPFMAYAQ